MLRSTAALSARAAALRVQLPSGGNGHAPDSDSDTDRLAGIDTALEEIKHILDVQFRRMAAMQAQLDRLSARTNP